ncbi:MAG: trypsin-like serine protease [Polyangiaceae bacterium]
MDTSPRLVFAALLLFGPTGCDFQLCADTQKLAEEATSESRDGIIGGEVDTANHATVALILTRPDGTHGLCSGTIVATHGTTGYVLTAAHCVVGVSDMLIAQATDFRDCLSGGNAALCEAVYVPQTWAADPAYDPNEHTRDFAVVTFEGASASTPVVPVSTNPDSLSAGVLVELSGYGRTYSGPNDPNNFQSRRNHVTVPLSSVWPDWLRFDATTGKTACFGDSGGPAYAMTGDKVHVVGVASNADQNCEYVANYARVASAYVEFIAPIIDPGQGGAPEGGAGGAGGAPATSVGGGGSAPSDGGAGSIPGDCLSDPAHCNGSGGSPDGSGGATSAGGSSASTGSGETCVPVSLSCSANGARDATGGAFGALAALAALALLRRRRD